LLNLFKLKFWLRWIIKFLIFVSLRNINPHSWSKLIHSLIRRIYLPGEIWSFISTDILRNVITSFCSFVCRIITCIISIFIFLLCLFTQQEETEHLKIEVFLCFIHAVAWLLVLPACVFLWNFQRVLWAICVITSRWFPWAMAFSILRPSSVKLILIMASIKSMRWFVEARNCNLMWMEARCPLIFSSIQTFRLMFFNKLPCLIQIGFVFI